MDPTVIPTTFEKCRDTFLRHDILPIAYTQLVRAAIMEQTTIGWIHALQGCLSNKWLTLARTYYTITSDALITRHDGGNRIQQVLKALHRLTTDLWIGRNKGLTQGHQEATARMTLKTLIDLEISKLHRDPADSLHTADSHYCNQSLQRLLRSSASTKLRWLHQVKQLQAKKTALQAQQPWITTFFHIEPHPHTTHNTPPATKPIQQQPSVRSYPTQRLLTEFL